MSQQQTMIEPSRQRGATFTVPAADRAVIFRGSRVRAMVFDLDGTLYRQGPVRRASLGRLLAHSWREPRAAWQALRAIRAYRHAQEQLRDGAAVRDGAADLAAQQIEVACEATGLSRDAVAAAVARWMDEAPLDLLAPAMRPGAAELLASAKARGVRLAVWSDYPARRKLAALGLSPWIDAAVSAQDPDVQRFKPDPRGLAVALARLDVPPEAAIYFGDRPAVDGRAACRLGVRCFIVGGAAIPPGLDCEALAGFAEVTAAVTSE